MKIFNKHLFTALILIFLSTIVYLIHFFIFRDSHHIFLYLLGDIAFIFIEVLMVSLVIHKLLEDRDKHYRLEKLNMVIGTFFSEIGEQLLKTFLSLDSNIPLLRDNFFDNDNWKTKSFKPRYNYLEKYQHNINFTETELKALKQLLTDKRNSMLRQLENPNMLEHEAFTEMLRAVFHLAEELDHRKALDNLPENDLLHLKGDINRAYKLLIKEWLSYMKYLKENYAYLHSLALRINPLQKNPSAIIN